MEALLKKTWPGFAGGLGGTSPSKVKILATVVNSASGEPAPASETAGAAEKYFCPKRGAFCRVQCGINPFDGRYHSF
jgi:hypothetical protein